VTEYEKWLKENEVPMDRFFPHIGYEMFDLSNIVRSVRRRNEAIQRFGFAILSSLAVQALHRYGRLLEVGAGSGYWSYELRKAGADVIATDPEPFSGVYFNPEKMWGEVLRMTAREAIEAYPRRLLLMVWPSIGGAWANDALWAFGESGGSEFAYVGEGPGGCTADDAFFELLEREWAQSAEFDVPQWSGIHDYGAIYTKK